MNKYLEEFEKYKDVVLYIGQVYQAKSGGKPMILLEYDFEANTVVLETLETKVKHTKTAHWARKNLKQV